MTFYRVEPIADWTVFTTPETERRGVPFKASWSQTTKDLERELNHLGATNVVLELDVQPKHLRLDGQMRADARPGFHGVRLSFDSPQGGMSLVGDTYEARWYGQLPDWQANVRAIALSLEALRAVDRHGVTKGAQYAGLKALAAGTGIAPDGMTHAQARDAIYAMFASPADARQQLDLHAAYKRARAKAHPDLNDGDRTAWDRVRLAGRVLGIDR